MDLETKQHRLHEDGEMNAVLLHNTQKTAAEISLELGYATPQHFNNAFRKRFGITPKAVRNNP